ncbi:MAG: hypothetical protein FJ290_14705 [Planctomycetes bacterium]|nr:hypothetical protein [Planctomycetota bacterium]
MLPNSLRIREVRFAFLFGPPRFIEREEASRIHGAVCDALRYDDISFQYTPLGDSGRLESKGFRIALERKEGRGAYAATLENENVHKPIRLLLVYTWPPSLEHAKESFDITQEALFASLNGEWQRVLAEVRLRAQCDTRQHSGLDFVKGTLLRAPADWLASLGEPLTICGVKFEVAPTPPPEHDNLEGAKRQLEVEVLRENPAGLYLELMCQWPQLALTSPVPAGGPAPVRIRQIDRKPSEYISYAKAYLEGWIASLAEAKGDS